MGIKVSKKKGGGAVDHFEKGGDRPPVPTPPPPKSALVCSARSHFLLVWFIYRMLNIGDWSTCIFILLNVRCIDTKWKI